MSAIKQGPWLIHGEETAFENPWLKLLNYPVTMPDGTPGQYGVVRFANRAIGVLPLDEDGNTWIVGQHRFPLNDYFWELPEGGGPKGEDPEAAARRELEEETGIQAGTLIPLGRWYLSNSVTDELAHGFIGTGLSAGQADPDPTEVLEVRKLAFAELMDMIDRGEITDAFTVLIVQTAYIKAQRGGLPEDVGRLLLKR